MGAGDPTLISSQHYYFSKSLPTTFWGYLFRNYSGMILFVDSGKSCFRGFVRGFVHLANDWTQWTKPTGSTWNSGPFHHRPNMSHCLAVSTHRDPMRFPHLGFFCLQHGLHFSWLRWGPAGPETQAMCQAFDIHVTDDQTAMPFKDVLHMYSTGSCPETYVWNIAKMGRVELDKLLGKNKKIPHAKLK